MVFLLILALFGLAYPAWRLFRNRRNPDAWEGGLLWLMSFLVVVILLARGTARGDQIDDFSGLAQKSPLAAAVMLLFLISLTGIPPTGGFTGKFYLFAAAVESGYIWLVLIAVINSAISLYYYMRVAMVMYMREPDASVVDAPQLVASPALSVVLVCAVAGVIFFGLFPNPLVSLALQSVLSFK